jgi:site-specific recombinase XerD
MRLSDAIDAFLLTKATSLTDKSLGWYEQKLTHFARWASQQSPPLLHMEDLTVHVVRRYLDAVKRGASERTGKPLSGYTLHGYAQCVKTLLYWAVREEVVPDRFSKRLEMPKVARKVIQTFSPSEVTALMDACERQSYPALVWRDKAILAVLLDTGIRASELCGLALDSVTLSPHGGRLRVHGKGDKERDVPLRSKEARVLLHRYLTRYRERLDSERSPALFLTRYGQPLSVFALDQTLYRLRDASGVTGVRVSAHTFRHTFAVNFLANGGDIWALSRLMGHEHIQTTQVYLRDFHHRVALESGPSVLDRMREQSRVSKRELRSWRR